MPEMRIVSDELWQQVKDRQRDAETKDGTGFARVRAAYSANLATGLVRCGNCGANFVIAYNRKGRKKYSCYGNRTKGGHVCDNNVRYDKEDLERILVNSAGLSFDDAAVRYIAAKANVLLETEARDAESAWRKEAVEHDAKKTEKELENVMRAIKSGLITERVKAELVLLEKRKAEIDARLSASDRTSTDVRPTSYEDVAGYLENLPSTFALNSRLGRKLLAKVILDVTATRQDAEAHVAITAVRVQKAALPEPRMPMKKDDSLLAYQRSLRTKVNTRPA